MARQAKCTGFLEDAWEWDEGGHNVGTGYVSESDKIYGVPEQRALTRVISVRNKMEHGDGMSFSEFTYPLLQGWDWWHMYRTRDVRLQIGGSDQYGNIVAGMDAVKYIAQNHQEDAGAPSQRLDEEGRIRDDYMPMGLTVPLLTTSSGEKFGKSAGNAVWLDRKLTSPFDLYGVRDEILPLRLI